MPRLEKQGEQLFIFLCDGKEKPQFSPFKSKHERITNI